MVPSVPGGSPLRVPVPFSITNDAGLGYEWFVVGNHPDAGSWNPAAAVKLRWTSGHVWRGDIGVKAGTSLEYKYVKRTTAPERICDSVNAEWWPDGDNLHVQVPAEPAAPFRGKRIELHSGMTNVTLYYSVLNSAEYNSTGTWTSIVMTRAGPGLRADEWKHVAEIVGEEGEWVRFTFHGYRAGTGIWEGAWNGQDFWSPLDMLIVRDRQVFNYQPLPDGVSESRIVTNYVASTVSHVTGRWVRIYLPRGYSENTDRRYPVAYMSDGENVFSPGGTFGCWHAGSTADEEIKGGRMRETIIVAVPSAANRQTEYLPHMDTDPDHGTTGLANFYADFLLHNVRPMVDHAFRTKNDRENTACIGSSSGGLLAMYLGTWTNAFGLVGAMSGVYSTEFCPNFMAWLVSTAPRGPRVWIDVGNAGGELDIGGISLYQDNFDLYGLLLGFGYVPGLNMRFMIGCGHDHNETAWAARLPRVYRFLFDVREEPNELLRQTLTLDNGVISFPVYGGVEYALEHAESLSGGWAALTNWPREHRPWAERIWTPPAAPPGGFYRVRGE